MVSVLSKSVFVLDSEIISFCKTGEDLVCFRFITIIVPATAAAIGAPIMASVERFVVGSTGFVVGSTGFVVGSTGFVVGSTGFVVGSTGFVVCNLFQIGQCLILVSFDHFLVHILLVLQLYEQ